MTRIPTWKTDLTPADVDAIMADVLARYREPPYPLEWGPEDVPFVQLMRPDNHPVPIVMDAAGLAEDDPLSPVSALQARLLRQRGYRFGCQHKPLNTVCLWVQAGPHLMIRWTVNGPGVVLAVVELIDRAWAHFQAQSDPLDTESGTGVG